MMRIHFVTAVVAVSMAIAGIFQGALARGQSKDVGRAWTMETGNASYYGPAFDGLMAANGSRFDQMARTAAHPWLPFGTKVIVRLTGSSRSVVVTITDRLPDSRRIVDLSVGAARELGIIRRGVVKVTLAPV